MEKRNTILNNKSLKYIFFLTFDTYVSQWSYVNITNKLCIICIRFVYLKLSEHRDVLYQSFIIKVICIRTLSNESTKI